MLTSALAANQSTPIGAIFQNTPPVKVFSEDTLFQEVLTYFTTYCADCILVTEGTKAVGIMTLKDAVKLLNNFHYLSLPIKEFMSSPLHTFGIQASISEVIDTMANADFDKIVVVNDNVVAGVIDKRHLQSICYERLTPLIKHEYSMINSLLSLVDEGEQGLLKMATTDTLTGIGNRRLLEEAFAAHQKLKQHYGISLFLLMFDIDDFKGINDTFGHTVGDLVLKELTSQVSGSIRKSDIFARWGGEEFTILLHYSDAQSVMKIAEHLRERIDHHHFESIVHVTCSFGLTRVHANENLEDVVMRADKALYRAKSAGKNCVRAELD
ncbi:MAG: diguanylate cyclase [Sulfuricurvum sp.]|uniref:diguanylate cyclase n=1 Tax=Sulfuricurvum sp. TaxID=2025608 RepID=UPI003D11547A